MKIKREINGKIVEIEYDDIHIEEISYYYKEKGYEGMPSHLIKYTIDGVDVKLEEFEVLQLLYNDDDFKELHSIYSNKIHRKLLKECMIQIDPEALKINPPKLKDGDIVTLRNGNDGIVFQNYIHFGKFNKSIETSSYNSNLEFIDLSYDNIYYDRDDYKIIRVKSSHYSRTWNREE